MRYPIILNDPPVPYATWSKTNQTRNAETHYHTMTWDELNSLGPWYDEVAADNAAMFLWLCPPLLIETLRMVEAWNTKIRYKTRRWRYVTKAFCWVKTNNQGFHTGMGYWSRANTEDVLLITRGNPKRERADVKQVIATRMKMPFETPAIVAPIMEHSQKTAETYRRIEQLVAGPYLELFARRRYPGWLGIGNELDGLDIRQSIEHVLQNKPLPQLPQPQHDLEFAV